MYLSQPPQVYIPHPTPHAQPTASLTILTSSARPPSPSGIRYPNLDTSPSRTYFPPLMRSISTLANARLTCIGAVHTHTASQVQGRPGYCAYEFSDSSAYASLTDICPECSSSSSGERSIRILDPNVSKNARRGLLHAGSHAVPFSPMGGSAGMELWRLWDCGSSMAVYESLI